MIIASNVMNAMATSSTKNPRKGLLDLPVEPWSKIGKIVIDNTAPFMDALADLVADIHSDIALPASTLNTVHRPAITRTCTALRSELLPRYYKIKTHDCYHVKLNDRRLTGRWLRAIGQDERRHTLGLEL
ncbi:hypothetical protein DOTSEDRAFT_91185 [Dothistroma septosporum NZE10]|uniref:Uncharacterized protein n=1 Tax=Dothistroma septosporum (strain NZE10 / CBS 128990) TaxID=675120 RepID=N1PBV2_DOTSN|nr:hypothetical protein DOTSEDRAFT_91185 [Dothistroma septosporum NZE10]